MAIIKMIFYGNKAQVSVHSKELFRWLRATRKRNILVLGSDGMLGHDVYEAFLAESARKDSDIGKVVGISEKDGFRLHDRHALSDFLARSVHFDYCINCVAYTDTKAAETTKEGKLLDYKLNALAPRYIAESCNFRKTRLIHVSTDYVFSEFSADTNLVPKSGYAKMFMPNDEPFPVNEYGKDKLLGEQGVIDAYGKNERGFAILRTSWLYGMHNGKSFIHKFLRNIGMTLKGGTESFGGSVPMTENEKSVPTSTEYLIECMRDVMRCGKHGIFHAVPLADGGVTRLQFAQAVLRCLGYIEKCTAVKFTVNGIRVSDIKLAPQAHAGHQPQYSALANTIGPAVYWERSLENFMYKNYKCLMDFIQDVNGGNS